MDCCYTSVVWYFLIKSHIVCTWIHFIIPPTPPSHAHTHAHKALFTYKHTKSNSLTIFPSIWLIAALSFRVHSLITSCLFSFMNNMKAFRGFLMCGFFSFAGCCIIPCCDIMTFGEHPLEPATGSNYMSQWCNSKITWLGVFPYLRHHVLSC